MTQGEPIVTVRGLLISQAVIGLIAVFLGLVFFEVGGLGSLNVHGPGILIILALLVAIAVSGVVEFSLIAMSVSAMYRSPALRTKTNAAVILLGALTVFVAAIVLIYALGGV